MQQSIAELSGISGLSLGFAVIGYADENRLLRKTGAGDGDVLVLGKPLGTGILFAGAMQGQARSRWIDEALAMMTSSNGDAARCMVDHGATAVVHLEHVAVLQHEDILGRHTHGLGQLGVRGQHPVLAVQRHEVARLHEAQHQLELLLAPVAPDVDGRVRHAVRRS